MLAPALLKPGWTLRFPSAGDSAVPGCGGLCSSRLWGTLRFPSAGDFAVPVFGGSWVLQVQLHGTVFTCVPRSRGRLPGPTRMGRGDGPPCHRFIHNLCLLEGQPLALGLAQYRGPVARGKRLEELKIGVSAGPP